MTGLRISESLILPREAATWVISYLAKRGAGKALALDTPLPTPEGWTTMGEAKVGDVLFDEKGEICTIEYATEIQLNHVCYRVRFDDGTSIVTDAEHLWQSETLAYRRAVGLRQLNDRKRGHPLKSRQDRPQCVARIKPEYVTTEQMKSTLTVPMGSNGRFDTNHSIVCAFPLSLPEQKNLPIDSYSLGVWLGNGTGIRAEITTMDNEILDALTLMGHAISVHVPKGANSGKAGTYYIDHEGYRKPGRFHAALKILHLIGNKHIPPVYLRSSIEQRLELLCGLMDTDGTVGDKSNSCTFSSKYQRLADGCEELVTSLGWKAYRTWKIPKINGVPKGISYIVTFRPNKQVFKLLRKASRLNFNVTQSSRAERRMVIGIEEVASVPVKCIAVSSPSHLYLAGKQMVPTHNTYCSGVQAEEMLKAGIPIVVIDGMGIWWGLRVSSDGSHEGLPVVVFGGEHADLPLSPDNASELAKAVVESNISCVLDLSPFSKYMGRKIVSSFLNELYRLNRVERHVFIEESDLWAPQRPIGPDEALCLSAVDNFVRRGGNHNLGCTLITQRSAVLNKDILTQSDCLVILRTLAPQDKKAIQSWVEEQTDEDKNQLNQWYDSLKTLENGEAWVWHPEKPPISKKVKFRRRETFHATREFIRSPKASKIVLMDVDAFIRKFKTVFVEKGVPIEPKLTVDVEIIRKEMEAKANAKAEEKLAAFKRKLEAENQSTISNLKAEVKSLTDRLDTASRQASLGAAPITDPFKHPIVENTLAKLSTRAQQLLMRIERQPGLNREQLAAFLTSSKDVVVNVINEVNRAFKAEVIVDDGGRPVKYKSMLQRLYIQDIGKREINRIQELQNSLDELREGYADLRERYRALESESLALKETLKHRPTYEELAKVNEQVKTLTSELKQSALQLKKREQILRSTEKVFDAIKQLAKEVDSVRLAAELVPVAPETLVRQEISTGPNGQPYIKSTFLPEKAKPFENTVSQIPLKTSGLPIDFALREKMFNFLRQHSNVWFTEPEMAMALGCEDEKVFHEMYESLKRDGAGKPVADIKVSDKGLRWIK